MLASRSGCFTREEIFPGIHVTEGWVGPRARAGLDTGLLGSELQPSHPYMFLTTRCN